MKIYFAASIRGGRNNRKIAEKIVEYLNKKGNVLTEHVVEKTIKEEGESKLTDSFIYKRDYAWLLSCNIVIAEVSIPSLGVGYELALAEKLDKPVLCLFQPNKKTFLSAMIRGNKFFTCKNYTNIKEAKLFIDIFLKSFDL